MSKTQRTLPPIKGTWMRKPRHRHRILAGESSKIIVTDWDEFPVSAIKEKKHKVKALLCQQ